MFLNLCNIYSTYTYSSLYGTYECNYWIIDYPMEALLSSLSCGLYEVIIKINNVSLFVKYKLLFLFRLHMNNSLEDLIMFLLCTVASISHDPLCHIEKSMCMCRKQCVSWDKSQSPKMYFEPTLKANRLLSKTRK